MIKSVSWIRDEGTFLKLLLYMRYGTYHPKNSQRPVLSLNIISKLLMISRAVGRPSKITDDNINFMINQDTLVR